MNKYRKQLVVAGSALLIFGIFTVMNIEIFDGVMRRDGILGAFIAGWATGIGKILLIIGVSPNKLKEGLNQEN